MSKTAAIVLAAGESRRLGSPKQLVEIGGAPLLQQVIEMVGRWPVDGVVVVLGAHADQVMDGIDFGDATIAINDDWEEGMAASIRVGLDLLARDASWERAFVVLGDQPGIPEEVPVQLLEAAEETHRPVVVPVYRYERGHPVLFDRSLWPRLMALSGDVGASALLTTHPEWVEEIRFSRSTPRDVDTRDDLADLRRGERSR
jgi:molybdenum cofactor cytidylyltransferase